jgi:predicted nucleic acid-binding protein
MAYTTQTKSLKTEKNTAFFGEFKILQFDKSSSVIFAKLKAKLKKMDVMIAGIAISNKAVLYTNNLKHFRKIVELEIL